MYYSNYFYFLFLVNIEKCSVYLVKQKQFYQLRIERIFSILAVGPLTELILYNLNAIYM